MTKLKEFEAILGKCQFWAQKSVTASMISTDGSIWLIEGQNGKQYHFMYRQSPYAKDSTGMYPIGEWLIRNSLGPNVAIY